MNVASFRFLWQQEPYAALSVYPVRASDSHAVLETGTYTACERVGNELMGGRSRENALSKTKVFLQPIDLHGRMPGNDEAGIPEVGAVLALAIDVLLKGLPHDVFTVILMGAEELVFTYEGDVWSTRVRLAVTRLADPAGAG